MNGKICFLCKEAIKETQSRVMHTECKYVHRKCEEAHKKGHAEIELSVSKSGFSVGLEALAIKKQLDSLLCVVNAITCPHRHGQPIRPKDFTRLVDRQIEVEEALREMGY